MKRFLLVAAIAANIFDSVGQVNIIPQPQQVSLKEGSFLVQASTAIILKDPSLSKASSFLQNYVKKYYDLDLQQTGNAGQSPSIKLELSAGSNVGLAGYELNVASTGVTIKGSDAESVFHGVQSLIQLFPVGNSEKGRLTLPAVSISDAPRFGYRGMMLDVGRHFQPVEYVKSLIDQLAMLKINTLHLHLTEDQGWRIEIKKYPKLTEVGAWRDGTIIGRYPGTGNSNQRYGGFYTQEQIKELVKYASDRFITVIPEIEMPGHAMAAIAAYPELSCFPAEETIIPSHPSKGSQAKKGKKVMESWGVYEDVFVPSEQTFKFLEDVIDEILPLFPAKYIHIGGDECPKESWKRSAFCQQLIMEKGLKDEHELQSYFIQRMEKYINSKGKKIIGWDEILEGGLAPNATVMSWRGEAGGIEAAKQKHDVIMSPTTYCYLDYSQTKNEDSVTIGGYISLETIYNYDPIPEELKGTPEEKYVKGAQANIWTEYVPNAKKLEYMIFPRMAGFAEASWTQPSNKSWKNFESKIPTLFSRFDMTGTNYSRAYYEINAGIVPNPAGNGVLWQLDTKNKAAKILFKQPGMTKWTPYTQPIPIKSSGKYEAAITNEKGLVLNTINQDFDLHKAVGKKITMTTPPSKKYPGNGGAGGLVNGAKSNKGLISAEWCAWEGGDMEAVIDLGNEQTIDAVDVYSLESRGSWIYRPASVTVSVSADGKVFKEVANQSISAGTKESEFRKIAVSLAQTKGRYVKVLLRNFGEIPSGMAGAGHRAWLFADEIEIR